jgi:hypothetical protein
LRDRSDFAFARVEPEVSFAALSALRFVLDLPWPRLVAIGAGWIKFTDAPVCRRKM